MQSCYDLSAQLNIIDRALYKNALDNLTSDVNQFVLIDEARKDDNSSRRCKAWGKRNSVGIALKRYFKNCVRYETIDALVIDIFYLWLSW